jgi:integrase/recombinase XerD
MTKTYLEPEEIANLEKAATCLRDKLLIRLLSRVGCRVSEALGLTVEDVDLGQGTVRIEHLKVRLEIACPGCKARLGRSHAFCPKCGVPVGEVVALERAHRRMRTLPVDPETLAFLKSYIDRGGAVDRKGRKLIFGINRHRAWQVLKQCAQKAGLPTLLNPETGRVHGVSPHRLRDAFAVHAVKLDDSGDGLRLLQEHLGHSSFNTTAKYRKVSGQEHRDWYDNLWDKDNT